ncbi:7-dimethyl-8-ribityllumazine synthase [Striga asiatica]|uniref:7-dimethyl-8-ribityllumazine synthase n=1 Tax=Striga asiatica TaxID=4170 RepID=A0A5A7NWS6_STRAF|nr:7-dimethyl-8-ribityllumazine synthase [Striga asiatica]
MQQNRAPQTHYIKEEKKQDQLGEQNPNYKQSRVKQKNNHGRISTGTKKEKKDFRDRYPGFADLFEESLDQLDGIGANLLAGSAEIGFRDVIIVLFEPKLALVAYKQSPPVIVESRVYHHQDNLNIERLTEKINEKGRKKEELNTYGPFAETPPSLATSSA